MNTFLYLFNMEFCVTRYVFFMFAKLRHSFSRVHNAKHQTPKPANSFPTNCNPQFFFQSPGERLFWVHIVEPGVCCLSFSWIFAYLFGGEELRPPEILAWIWPLFCKDTIQEGTHGRERCAVGLEFGITRKKFGLHPIKISSRKTRAPERRNS